MVEEEEEEVVAEEALDSISMESPTAAGERPTSRSRADEGPCSTPTSEGNTALGVSSPA